jgi:hypothetical protein
MNVFANNGYCLAVLVDGGTTAFKATLVKHFVAVFTFCPHVAIAKFGVHNIVPARGLTFKVFNSLIYVHRYFPPFRYYPIHRQIPLSISTTPHHTITAMVIAAIYPLALSVIYFIPDVFWFSHPLLPQAVDDFLMCWDLRHWQSSAVEVFLVENFSVSSLAPFGAPPTDHP